MTTFSGRTPESLIPRSDSRNPATTCKGITKSGRPCRRPIDAKNSDDDGVIAVVSVAGDDSDDDEMGAAAYFCWQHKDQAESLAAQTTSGPATQLYPLKERNSIDTLVERLGVLNVDEGQEGAAAGKKKRSRQSGSRPPRRMNRPPTWNSVEGPLMSVPSDIMAERKRRNPRPSKPPPRKKQGFWASLCCGSADDDYPEPPRRKRRTDQVQETPMQQVSQPPTQQSHSRRHSARPPADKPTREESETATLLRYIPKSVSPQLAATLLAELSKPISPHDEDGYIYIFWLTPESAGPAPSSTASTLLTPPSSRPDQSRRTSDVMRQFSVKGPGGKGKVPRSPNPNTSTKDEEKETILLKIGRANNVHRRMNEWTRQCGYALSLVRFYPYTSSSSSSSSSPQPSPRSGAAAAGRKMPHAHRVERLVHLELAEQRVIKQCEACGKSHKEWFEVEATKEGIKKVDEVVRRWCEWAERSEE